MAEAPNIAVLCFIVHRAMEKRVHEALAAAGYADITPAQSKLLQRVNEEGSRVTELAEAALVTKQTAGYLVEQLEEAGYAERVPDPRDGRARLVRLTAHTKEHVRPIAQRVTEQVEAEWTAHIGKRRMDQLRDALIRLREITDPYLDA